MKQAVIDIGSNSVRLTLYETDGTDFKILFREKIMAGLAGYVENKKLSAEGIECACSALLTFKEILRTLQINDVCVFATASLRNVSNTDEALAVIRAATGYSVEVISGEDEALLGYMGAMRELHLSSGIFLDIGGASTEIVTFDNGGVADYASFPVGSLSLYRRCVKKILPGDGSLRRLKQATEEAINIPGASPTVRSLAVVVGGTARAVLKIAHHYYGISNDCRSVTAEQLDGLRDFLCSGKKEAIDLMLRLAPERIHTLIPGILILRHIIHLFRAQQLVVGKFGVREGYLCQKILSSDTATPKTEN